MNAGELKEAGVRQARKERAHNEGVCDGAYLPEGTGLVQVRLRTMNLAGALEFYERALGLEMVERGQGEAALAATAKTPAFLALREDAKAVPHPPRATGLYHLALRYPSREALAAACLRLSQHGHALEGAADHAVSEAVYLSDSDGNGIELYADRPRAQWRWREGQVLMKTEPLQLDNLLAEADTRDGSPAWKPSLVDIGHIHLQVEDLAKAERFYRDFIGLAVTQRSYPGALFFSAGGYHHHLAVNTWAGRAAAPLNSAGLMSYRFEVPVAEILYCLRHRAPLLGYESNTGALADGRELLRLRDPNGNWLEVVHRPDPG